MPQVKIIDVAREAGVSLGTVSNALNHPEKVRPETRRLIHETIERLGYTPNQSARMLAGRRARILGLLIPQMTHGFCLQIASGAQNEARKHGYGLIIANYLADETLEGRYLDYFRGTQLAGILVHAQTDVADDAGGAGDTPVVYLDTAGTGAGRYVIADCVAQGRLIAEHAISCGCRHVCVMGRAGTARLAERLAGIRAALAARPEIRLEVLDAGDWNESGDGFSLGNQLARRAPQDRPDFLIGLTDVLAAGAIAGILAEGLAVPDALRVAGCDGNPLAWGGAPALTTCAPAGYEVGRKGVQLLIEHFQAAEAAASSGRPGRPATKGEPERRVEIVRPFLLARSSTRADADSLGAEAGARSSRIPETNLGAYL